MNRDDQPVLEVDRVALRFARRLGPSLRLGLRDTLRDLVGLPPRAGLGRDEFWALDDVSFQLRRGEALGLLGANGAGKSSLLKIVAGLLKPARGTVTVRGRVGALIELGAGMHPLLSGRENIRVNAAILGLSRRETEARIDEIIAFADLGEFIDAPVRGYSSGMRVRLGFAVAAHLEPDLLLIDEVLAVGDAAFRAKCYKRIAEIKERCAIVMVSHSHSAQTRVCRRGLVLDAGKTIASGDISDCLEAHERASGLKQSGVRTGTGDITLGKIEFDRSPPCYQFAETIEVTLAVNSRLPSTTEVVVDLVFRKNRYEPAAECSNLVNERPLSLRPGLNQVRISIRQPGFNAGSYGISCFITSPDMLTHHDWFEDCATLTVTGRTGTTHQQLVADWTLS